ncbi:hypothetical protein EQG49_03945 [Periweissella cryptocerci]|uniref:Sulfatase N-terminal domain-containing protein n=1 Tax=Periweissella cryptocerci TaxID=2506420 RepID=A0A4P6YSI1_9LACO|nr:sulfatase-like hydrolase/transferase [Periweissella cryptocerci]QBO35669.1 hypothetical protein EQG49_03945 [Periweissella cryptocerci]
MQKRKSAFGLNLLIIIAAVFVVIYTLMIEQPSFATFTQRLAKQTVYAKRFFVGWNLFDLSLVMVNVIPLAIGYKMVAVKNKVTVAIRQALIILFYAVMSFIAMAVIAPHETRHLANLASAVAPIGHGTYWLAGGLVLAIAVAPFVDQTMAKMSNARLDAFALGLFGITTLEATFFKAPILNLGDGQNVLWIGTLFVLGMYLKHRQLATKMKPIQLITTVIVSLVSVFGLLIAQLQMPHTPIEAAMRFSSLTSLPIVLSAMALVLLATKVSVKNQLINRLGAIIALSTFDMYVLFQTPFMQHVFVDKIIRRANVGKFGSAITGTLHYTKAAVAIVAVLAVIGLVRFGLTHFTRLQTFTAKFTAERIAQTVKRFFAWIVAHKVQLQQIGLAFAVMSVLVIFLDYTQLKLDLPYALKITFRFPHNYWINMTIMSIMFALLLAVFNRFWYALTTLTVVMLAFGIGSYEMLIMRQEPVLPADLAELGSFSEIAGMVSAKLLVYAGIGIAVLIALAVLVQWRSRITKFFHWRGRLVLLIISLALGFSLFNTNHEMSPSHKFLVAAGYDPKNFDQTVAAKANGPLITFVNNLDVQIMAKPKGYSAATMNKLAQKYTNVANNINKTRTQSDMSKQTVIYILSETLSDPDHLPGVTLNAEAMPYLQKLKTETTSGMMLSSGYGGGTANMEYQAYTSMAMNNFSPTVTTPYVQVIPKMKKVPAFQNLFDYNVNVHPYVASMYNRQNVYKAYGVNKFYHINSKNKLTYTAKVGRNPRISDESAFKEVELRIAQHKGGQLIGLETMQNHRPYGPYYATDSYKVTANNYNMPESEKSQIEDYTEGLHYTDQALKAFIAKLDAIQKPISVVFYGDHLPGIYNSIPMSKYGIQLHETDWFIYSNKYSREHGVKNTKLPNTKIVSPNVFSPLLMKHLDQKVSPFYALMTNVAEQLPAMSTDSGKAANKSSDNGAGEILNQNSEIVPENKLTATQKQTLADYRMIQYDLTTGKQYILKDKSFIRPVTDK